MSPHAVDPPVSDEQVRHLTCDRPQTLNGSARRVKHNQRSLLHRVDDQEIHDMVCVGFGPASLAIAVALHDALETGGAALRTPQPKVRFLERQSSFAWHAGMLLPGTKMQITFIKDLATLRNPRSHFTFLNYLHHKGRLVQFTNLATFLPQRIEYEDYMKWCASYFDDVVDYGQTVQSVHAGPTHPKTGEIQYFEVRSQSQQHGRPHILRAKHVVIAAGGKPSIPKSLPTNHPRIIHSSQYATSIGQIFPPGTQPKSVAVIGAGQSAAEVFSNLPSRFPDAKATLIIRGAALRPSDDSPFVNEIFDPERVDDVYSQADDIREKQLALDKGTNYSVVRLELLEHLNTMLYTYRIQCGDNKEDWPQRILNHRTVLGMSDCYVDGRGAVQLHLRDESGGYYAHKRCVDQTLTVDLVIVASGYERDAHESMLKGIRHLMPGGDVENQGWKVRRDYGVEFENGTIPSDAGIWLQGCNERTHGLSDTLLSILAMRGGEMVASIFGNTADHGD